MLQSSTIRWCSRIVIMLSCIIIIIGCLDFIGWNWDIVSLRSIYSSYEPMSLSTASLMIFCSISIILMRHEQMNRLAYRTGKGLALCVLIASIFLIFNPYNNILPNYFVSPFLTCFNFILLSTCILCIDNHFFNNKMITFITSVIVLSSLLSFLGYIFVKNPDYQIVSLTRMSILSSISFFILCNAIILTRPNRGIAYVFFEKTIDAIFLRRVPLFFVITILLAYLANIGQHYDWYDDGFSDLLTTMTSIIILTILLLMTSTKLRVQEKNILAQHEIAKIIESGKEFKETSSLIMQVICTQFDWDIGEILLLDKKETVLKYFSLWHTDSIPPELIMQLKNIPFAKGLGIPGKAWEQKKTIWKIDFHQPFNIMNNTTDIFFRTLVAIPILYKNNLQGILNLVSQKINRQTDTMEKFLEMTGSVLGEYLSHQLSQEKMIKMIDQDHLTGLANRLSFESMLQKLLENNKTTFYPIIVLDIDKFKWVNEMLDYDMGDTILKVIVDKLKKYANKNYIGRLGGNSFALLPHTLENINQLTNYTYKILSEIKQPLEIEGKNITLTTSIGVSIYPKDGKNAKQLVKNAEIAMEKAKLEGGDNFQLFTDDLSKLKSEQFTLMTEIKEAILKNQLSLYFQPKICVKTGLIVAAESLIRWQHPTKGLLTPNVFMPMAEENNLVIPITEWIISECCNIINKYKLNVPIAINLSGEHFKESFNLIGYLNQILKGFHINSSNIELEITETVFMGEAKQNLATLVDLKRMGFKIAIDDFGTGFSSLSYLKNIAADYIKIDKSFIDNIPNNIDSVIIVKAIIDLAHSLDKKIIAEGVETIEQLQFLVNENCDQIQGYYFSKPLPVEELVHFIKEGKKWQIPVKKSV